MNGHFVVNAILFGIKLLKGLLLWYKTISTTLSWDKILNNNNFIQITINPIAPGIWDVA